MSLSFLSLPFSLLISSLLTGWQVSSGFFFHLRSLQGLATATMDPAKKCVEIAFSASSFFFYSHCKLNNLHLGVPYLPLDTRWENWIYKKRSEGDLEEEREKKSERVQKKRLRWCLPGKERRVERRWKDSKGFEQRCRESFSSYLCMHIFNDSFLQDFPSSAIFPQTHACCFSLSAKRPQ